MIVLRRRLTNISRFIGGIVCSVVLIIIFLSVYCFRKNMRTWVVDDTRFLGEIELAAKRHGLDPSLVRAVVFQESRFDPFAYGVKGEVGLMQVLPEGAVADWARCHRVNPPKASQLTNPVLNLEIGCWYLSQAMRSWSNYRAQTELALAQYNAGKSRVNRWKPPSPDGTVVDRIKIDSTCQYVLSIMARYRRYRGSVK